MPSTRTLDRCSVHRNQSEGKQPNLATACECGDVKGLQTLSRREFRNEISQRRNALSVKPSVQMISRKRKNTFAFYVFTQES